jgi:hypothetical protein
MSAIVALCEQCAASAVRESVTLCDACAKHFRVIYLPNDVRAWAEIARDANSPEGADAQEMMHGLMVRIFNQQRELSRLNTIIREKHELMHRCFDRIVDVLGNPSTVGTEDQSVEEELTNDVVRIVRRYLWLRDDNAYAPEEEHVRGGYELDELCDAGIAEEDERLATSTQEKNHG